MGLVFTKLSDDQRYYAIRGGKFFEKYGDSYDFVALCGCKGTHAEIQLACGNFRPEYRRVIKNILIEMGMETASWERLKFSNLLKRKYRK